MSLERLPDEALAHVFSFVDPRDVLRNVLLVSRRVSRVACEPLMWRRNCMRDFRYWHPEHDIKSKLGGKPTAVDWKRLYVWRLRRNERARHALEEIVRTGSVFQPATIASARIEEIIRLGYDVKEFLLAEHERSLKAADDDAGNPDQYSLARRYWSMAARRAIHRVMAICKWMELLEEPDEPWHSGLMPLDVAFASVGMFVLANPDGDMDEVSQRLDELAASFAASAGADFSSMPTRQRALTLVRWVREQGLAAVPIQEDAPAGTDDEYFRHFMINNALFGGPTYGTTQVISTVIFVCIARRLGLDAHCSVYAPGLMLPLVLSPAGEDLDGKPRAPTAWTNTQVALDPHESASEISSGQLARLAGDVSMTIEALIPATTRQALMAAFDSDLRFGRPRAASSWHDSHLTHAVRDWSLLMAWSRVFAASANFYDWMVATIRHFGNYDLTLTNVALVERILGEFIVRFCGDDPDDADLAHRTHRTLHDWKQTPEVGQCERPGAPFRLGQVVRHHRYGRAGIVFECITEKDHLGYEKDGGRVYYGCLLWDGSVARWRQDNIKLCQDASVMPRVPPEWLGSYFRRYDSKSVSFVPNTKWDRKDASGTSRTAHELPIR